MHLMYNWKSFVEFICNNNQQQKKSWGKNSGNLDTNIRIYALLLLVTSFQKAVLITIVNRTVTAINLDPLRNDLAMFLEAFGNLVDLIFH